MTAEELLDRCRKALKEAGLYDVSVDKRVYQEVLENLLLELEADYEAVDQELKA